MYTKNLSRADKNAIDTAIRKAKKEDKKQMSAQASIPFQQMFRDGICKVSDNYYTKTIRFQDINYQLNQNEDKTAIFDGWSDFLNYFDSSVNFELSFMNLSAKDDSFSRQLIIPPQGDDFDEIREEYTEMLQDRLSKHLPYLIQRK